jgi:hypothetical protein
MPRYSIAAFWCLLASSASAFVPSTSRHHGRSSFVGNNPVALISKSSSSSNSALQMNLFDRFGRVAKANLNSLLQNLEDPEKIMTQALEDMQVCECECEYGLFRWSLYYYIPRV